MSVLSFIGFWIISSVIFYSSLVITAKKDTEFKMPSIIEIKEEDK